MHSTWQLTPAQRRLRAWRGNGSSSADRIAQHRVQLARVRESVARVSDRPRP